MAIIQHIPWIMQLLHYLPGSTKTIDALRKETNAKVNRRRSEGSHAKDVYSYFVRRSSSSVDKDLSLPVHLLLAK